MPNIPAGATTLVPKDGTTTPGDSSNTWEVWLRGTRIAGDSLPGVNGWLVVPHDSTYYAVTVPVNAAQTTGSAYQFRYSGLVSGE